MGFKSSLRNWLFDDIDRDGDGFVPINWGLEGVTPQFNSYASDIEKIRVILQNPAALKVWRLMCDMFSLGRFEVVKTTGDGEKEIKDDPILTLLKNPNPLQSQRQLLWDYMFYRMMGTSYTYIDSRFVESSSLYVLMNSQIDFPQSMRTEMDKMIFSTKKAKEIQTQTITYRYQDGTPFSFPLNKLIINTDLTNGTGNYYKGNSVIDALYKVISNSDVSLDSQNINLRLAGKVMVAGQSDPDNVLKVGMAEGEKQSIEKKVLGRKHVHAVKTMIDVKRFVENYGNLKLNDAYLDMYNIIGGMFNIPKDVLEAFNSSTFNNQELARASLVSYCLQPAADDFALSLTNHFAYGDRKRELRLCYDHLPFVQVFEKDKAEVNDKKAQTYLDLINNGVSIDEANLLAGTNFTTGVVTQRVKANGNQA